MQPAFEVEHLTKRYRNGTVAVDDLSFSVPNGEFFGFLGPNGAGKTTTIHCAVGIARFNEGAIRILGKDVVTEYRDARKEIGLSPQEFNVDIFARVFEILDWVGGFYGMHKDERSTRTEFLLERFELARYKDKRFRELSGGLKRRVMLARALMHDPKVLVLDEPTAGVDVELRRDLWRYFKELNEEGKTIILTSHYLEEVEHLCDRVGIIADGKMVSLVDRAAYHNGTRLEALYLAATQKIA